MCSSDLALSQVTRFDQGSPEFDANGNFLWDPAQGSIRWSPNAHGFWRRTVPPVVAQESELVRTEILENTDLNGSLLSTQTLTFRKPANASLWILDPVRPVSTHTYDDLGRRVESRLQDNESPAAAVSATRISAVSHDPAGRIVSETDADAHRKVFSYDDAGRLTWVVTDVADSASLTETSLFNSAAQWVNWARGPRSASDSTATRFQFDELGATIAQIDALQRVTRFEYDALGRRTRRFQPSLASESWEHDFGSPPITLNQPNQPGQPSQPSQPAAPRLNVVRHRDFNGRFTVTEHDSLGRVVRRAPAGHVDGVNDLPPTQATPVLIDYTASGRRKSMSDASGRTDYAYDDWNRLRVKSHTRTDRKSTRLNSSH